MLNYLSLNEAEARELSRKIIHAKENSINEIEFSGFRFRKKGSITIVRGDGEINRPRSRNILNRFLVSLFHPRSVQ